MSPCPQCTPPSLPDRRCAQERPTKNEWILVDLGVSSEVSGIVTQGRSEVDEWVTQFMISYSSDAFQWEFARDIYGNKKVFKGNSDAHTLRHCYLEHPVKGRSEEEERGKSERQQIFLQRALRRRLVRKSYPSV